MHQMIHKMEKTEIKKYDDRCHLHKLIDQVDNGESILVDRDLEYALPYVRIHLRKEKKLPIWLRKKRKLTPAKKK